MQALAFLGLGKAGVIEKPIPYRSGRRDRSARFPGDIRPMTTHEFGFDEVEPELSLMETKGDGIIKPLVRFA